MQRERFKATLHEQRRARVVAMEIQTRGVLAGSYKGGRATLNSTQTHSVDSNTDQPLCGRVSPDNIADEYAGDTRARPTCQACLAKDPRFK